MIIYNANKLSRITVLTENVIVWSKENYHVYLWLSGIKLLPSCPVALIVKGENRVCGAVVGCVARYNRDEIDSPGKLTAASWMVKKATFLFNIYPYLNPRLCNYSEENGIGKRELSRWD